MQGIKALVIGMAVLIVVGTAVLAYGWTHHWNKATTPPDAAAAQVQAPLTDGDAAANAPPYTVNVPAPEGMHFEQMAVAGDRALLRFSGPQGERVVVIDPHSGRVTGTIGVAAGK